MKVRKRVTLLHSLKEGTAYSEKETKLKRSRRRNPNKQQSRI
jgi:hypothetical protein